MSKTSRTPYKKNNEKETCERCGKREKKRNKCQVSPQLTVWITASKQFRLESSLECQQRWRRCDSGRQTVPHTTMMTRSNSGAFDWQTEIHVFYDDTTLALLATQYRSTACFDTSDPGQIGTETLQHCSGGSKASGLFVTSTLWTKLSNCTAIKYEVCSTLWSKVSHPNFLVYVACRPTSLSQWRMQSAIVY